jgi:L-lactate dehydrogenase complex protein LldG
MLARIREAIGPAPLKDEPPVERAYRQVGDESREAVVAEFAERVAEYRATVRRVAADELVGAIAAACRRRGVRSLAVPHDIPDAWLPGAVEILRDEPTTSLTNGQLDACDGVLTGCAVGIAQTGTIVLDGGARQGRRVLTLLPDYHLCVVNEAQVVGLVPEGIALLAVTIRGDNRAMTLISGPSATSDIELNRVEGVHGPRALEVLVVCDEEER